MEARLVLVSLVGGKLRRFARRCWQPQLPLPLLQLLALALVLVLVLVLVLMSFLSTLLV